MADTVPTPAPDDTDTAPASAPATTPDGHPAGLMSSLLHAVEPARPGKTNPDDDFDLAPVAGSSSDYHPDQDPAAAAAAKNQQSIPRAWLLAAAERWRKGAGANIKQLEVQKARAQARQLKETRTVVINRGGPGGLLGGGKGPAGKPSGGGKAAKSPSGGSSIGPKNTSAGGGSKSPSSGTPKAAKEPKAPKPVKEPKPHTPKEPKAAKGASGTPSGGSKGSTGASPRKSSPDSSSTAPKKDQATGKDTTGTPKTPAKPKAKTTTPDTGDQPGKDKTPPAGKPGPATPGTPDKSLGKSGTPRDNARRDVPTKESREAGYRDGTRAGRVAAHVGAWRDGYRDGRADAAKAADRDKEALDKAREKRTTPADKEPPVPPTPTTPAAPSAAPTSPVSSADFHKDPKPALKEGPQPIPVTSVTKTHVYLGPGASRDVLSRGEVRSLKGFERRMQDKADRMQRVAEDARQLMAHAEAQHAEVQQWVEAARSVKGGDKFIRSLSALAETAKAQHTTAQELHTRALRSAEACRVLVANAQTRYGGIYQAVVDSDETAPAELAFYKG